MCVPWSGWKMVRYGPGGTEPECESKSRKGSRRKRKLEMTDHTVSFTIKPYEILTLRLQMKGSQE